MSPAQPRRAETRLSPSGVALTLSYRYCYSVRQVMYGARSSFRQIKSQTAEAGSKGLGSQNDQRNTPARIGLSD